MRLNSVKLIILLVSAGLLSSCASQAVHDAEGQPRTRKPLRNGMLSVIH
ncbi:MAG: hypothetical protein ABI795_08275 [Chthoniobacterales bacterium]